MTTTFIAPGGLTADEIIAATERGFYAKSLAGGQVEPASGNFVFGVAEGYLIEHGAMTKPLRGATSSFTCLSKPSTCAYGATTGTWIRRD